VTSFQVSYFSLPYSDQDNIDWDWLYELETEEETEFIKHVKTVKPVKVKVDGRTGKGVIFKH
jgi:hypothetical protein